MHAPLYEHTQQTRRRLCPAPYAPSLQSLCRAGLRLAYGGLCCWVQEFLKLMTEEGDKLPMGAHRTPLLSWKSAEIPLQIEIVGFLPLQGGEVIWFMAYVQLAELCRPPAQCRRAVEQCDATRPVPRT